MRTRSVSPTTSESPPPPRRLVVAGAILVVGQAAPLLVFLVAASELSTGVKTALSAALLLGIPELSLLIAAGILGKAGFVWLKQRIWALFRKVAPPDTVSRARYRVGLVMFALPVLVGWAAPYLGDLVPAYSDRHVLVGVVGDALIVLALFVLGGDFWDKLRALFIREATVRWPSR